MTQLVPPGIPFSSLPFPYPSQSPTSCYHSLSLLHTLSLLPTLSLPPPFSLPPTLSLPPSLSPSNLLPTRSYDLLISLPHLLYRHLLSLSLSFPWLYLFTPRSMYTVFMLFSAFAAPSVSHLHLIASPECTRSIRPSKSPLRISNEGLAWLADGLRIPFPFFEDASGGKVPLHCLIMDGD